DVALLVVDLSVEQLPRIAIPILDDPMVFEGSLVEIGAEADTGARGNSGATEECRAEDGEVSARAHGALLECASVAERPTIVTLHERQHVGRRAHILLVSSFG